MLCWSAAKVYTTYVYRQGELSAIRLCHVLDAPFLELAYMEEPDDGLWLYSPIFFI